MEHQTCAWALKHPLEREYHDAEWGVPVYDDQTLFEFITLEGAQAGLSWITILKKREGYRQAFEGYDLTKLSAYVGERGDERVEAIISQFDVVKHRGKILSVFSNAQAALALIEEYGSLEKALWQFVDGKPIINHWQDLSQVPASSDESKAMSKFLKKRGFKFVGETICYAFMQAIGMVDDHLQTCPKKSAS
ncbi:3-methyladenine DNA glycosylase [Vibrio ichthyoenteri ATCC 700023]|uniref:DNA-3-methyladenine glycosylase I n=1 Tax=Vibrio ichthyoenteri ATCC 700023 TaxID=870968 RepID=F9S3K7_9VIBR|nr:DNA-3-methyladenine glycosylase I [Vibrio ichthyoenteri]EGU37832.1 3-methyladenine DNA glycosylase [Vibrio ichthyoenteri ATCC 700023]